MNRQGVCPNLAVCPNIPYFTLFGCTGEKGELYACTKLSPRNKGVFFFFNWSPISKSISINGNVR